MMTTCYTIISRDDLYDAMYLPGQIRLYKQLILNREYGVGYTHASAEELDTNLHAAEIRLDAALRAIQASIDSVGVTDSLTRHANLTLVQAVRYLDSRYCNYNEDAVGLYFAVDILPRLGERSLWAYLEVEPEGWVVRALRMEPASIPGREIRTGRIVRSFGEHIAWTGYERLPK